jgi:rod shape-determining protein MreD
MIVTWRIAGRLALILIVTVILEVSFFAHVTLFGVAPDVVPVVIVSLGLLGGAMVGAVCGFGAGFLLDSLLLQTLGVSSLVLLSVGYLAGRFREGFEISNSLVPPLLAGALTLFGAAALAAIELMLGVDVPVSLLVLREIIVKALLAVLLAIPVYPLIRRTLRPALIDHAPEGGILSRSLNARRRRGVRRRAIQRRPATRGAA